MLVSPEFNWYVIAWAVYLVGSVIFLAASWRFLSVLKKFGIGAVLMMAIVPAVLLPWPVDDATKGMLAPAWIVAGLDRVTHAQDGALRAGIPLLMAVIFSAGISLLIVGIKAAFFPPAKPYPAAPQHSARPQPKRPATARGLAANNREVTQRTPRESLTTPPRPKPAAPVQASKPTGRIEPRISDSGMDALDPAPKKRK